MRAGKISLGLLLLIGSAAAGFWVFGSSAIPGGSRCASSTAQYEHMDTRVVRFVNDRGKESGFEAKIADEPGERAAGFQHLCPEVIAKLPMLFIFGRPFTGRFHMRNVYAPLDIAFMDGDGAIIVIRRMVPYAKPAGSGPRYGAGSPIRYALETRPGFFAEQGISAGRAYFQGPRAQRR